MRIIILCLLVLASTGSAYAQTHGGSIIDRINKLKQDKNREKLAKEGFQREVEELEAKLETKKNERNEEERLRRLSDREAAEYKEEIDEIKADLKKAKKRLEDKEELIDRLLDNITELTSQLTATQAALLASQDKVTDQGNTINWMKKNESGFKQIEPAVRVSPSKCKMVKFLIEGEPEYKGTKFKHVHYDIRFYHNKSKGYKTEITGYIVIFDAFGRYLTHTENELVLPRNEKREEQDPGGEFHIYENEDCAILIDRVQRKGAENYDYVFIPSNLFNVNELQEGLLALCNKQKFLFTNKSRGCMEASLLNKP